MAGWHRGLLRTGWVGVRVRIAGGRSGLAFTSVESGGGFDGLNDLLVARATAQIPLNGAGNFVPGGVVVFGQESLRGDQETGRAETALRAAVRGKAGLNRCQMGAVGQSFHGDDVRALHLTGEVRQDSFGTPSIITVQQPHVPRSQPRFTPSVPTLSRRTSKRTALLGARTSNGRPFTVAAHRFPSGAGIIETCSSPTMVVPVLP